MKRLFIIPLLSAVVALSFVSCLEMGGGGNREETTLPAVVNYSVKEAVPTLLTVAGEFSVPSLTTSDLRMGDCILAHFTLDWDHQPKGDSLYRATNISYIDVSQSYAEVKTDFDEQELVVSAEDLLPIQAMTLQLYNAILNGKVFFGFSHDASIKQDMDYILIARPSDTPSDDTVTLYITGKKNNQPDGAQTAIEALYAIDMLGVINELGKEATIHENSIDYRVQQLKVKIKYCNGIDENNVPKYQEYVYNNGTLTLSVYKK
ncbi:MAG: hypothetical protein LBB85_04055 [Dysgonamonadaceae bacterium]|jgi:hypothetical protein|nr:hypothetical protein [Dysgonamonadaceae bacterium]